MEKEDTPPKKRVRHNNKEEGETESSLFLQEIRKDVQQVTKDMRQVKRQLEGKEGMEEEDRTPLKQGIFSFSPPSPSPKH